MKRGMLPLTALRAFEATARLGTMGAAALELGVTHSAISRQVRGLEDRLGVRLIDGPRNAPGLTEAGQQLAASLRDGFDRIETGVSDLVRARRETLDVSCLGTLSMRWLIPRLHRFQLDHPETDIRLTADDRPVDFQRNRYDLAIRIGARFDGRARVLFADRSGPVLKAGLSMADLPRMHTRTRPDAWTTWTHVPTKGREAWYDHFYFMLEAATAGLGVAIAPEVLVRDDLRAGRLTAPFGFRDTGMVYAVQMPARPVRNACAFADWLVQEAGKG